MHRKGASCDERYTRLANFLLFSRGLGGSEPCTNAPFVHVPHDHFVYLYLFALHFSLRCNTENVQVYSCVPCSERCRQSVASLFPLAAASFLATLRPQQQRCMPGTLLVMVLKRSP